MPKLRRLSGSQLLTIFGEFNFRPISQRGSYIKVRRVFEDGQTQTLTIPNHQEKSTGARSTLLFGRLAGSLRNLTFVASSSLNSFGHRITSCWPKSRVLYEHSKRPITGTPPLPAPDLL